MDDNPLQQILALDNPLRASKFFILGLAGSWGDEFGSGDWALNMTFVYTDGTTEEFMLGHSYIDDWYYTANPGGVCISRGAYDHIRNKLGFGYEYHGGHAQYFQVFPGRLL